MKSPLIFVPDRRIIQVGIELPKMRMEGLVTWRLIRKGKVIRENPIPYRNQLCTAGLSILGQSATIRTATNYGACGTGSAAPAATDVALQAEVTTGGRSTKAAPGSAVYTPIGGAVTEDYWEETYIYTFTETQANGNLTEFGAFNATTGGSMFCRHLLKDVGGSPTTIIKSSDDQLEITYKVRVYPPITDTVQAGFAVAVEGSVHTVTVRPANASSSWHYMFTGGFNQTGALSGYSGALGVRTGTPAGTSYPASSSSVAAYVSSSLYIDETQIWQPSSGTVPFGAITVWPRVVAMFQVGFSPSLNKSNTKRLTVTTRRSWGPKP